MAIDKVVIRKPYAYDVVAASDEAAFVSLEPSLTQQQFKDESDINNLVDRFLRTGEVPPVDARAMYGDFIHAPDSYQEALNLVLDAQDGFNSLSSSIRQRFNNDPAELLSFLQDDSNLDEAVKLGLVVKKAVSEPEPSAQNPTPEPSAEV